MTDKLIGFVLIIMISSLSGIGVFYLTPGCKGAAVVSIFITSMVSAYLIVLWTIAYFKKKENK